MFWFTDRQRLTLTLFATAALVALGLIAWQRRPRPLRILKGSADSPSVSEGKQWDAALEQARRIDINSASVAELERLPGIGPTMARRILAYRQQHGAFGRAEELLDVPGIGPKTYAALSDYVKIKE